MSARGASAAVRLRAWDRPDDAARAARAERLFTAASVAFIVVLVAALGVFAAHSWRQEVSRTERSLERTANLLAAGLEPILLGAGLAAESVRAFRAGADPAVADRYAQELLGQAPRLVPHMTHALLLDEEGTVRAASDPSAVGRTGYLDLLRSVRPEPRPGMTVAGPVRGAISGQQIVVVIVEAPAPREGGAGTVVIGLDLAPIRDAFGAASTLQEDAALFTADGVAVLSVPEGLFEAGRRYRGGILFRLIDGGMREGTYRGVNPATGSERLIAFKMVDAGPLIATVAVDTAIVARTWLSANAVVLVVALLLLALAVAMTLSVGRVLRVRREALEAAERAGRDRVRFLAHASHELRTPLNAVVGFADLLLSPAGGPLDGRARDYAESIRAGGEHLTRVVNDILDHSRLEAGQMTAEFEPVRLADCVASAVRLVRVDPDRPVRFACVGLDGLVLDADARLLTQVFLNLYANAAHPAIGATTVETSAERTPDGGLAVDVADDGCGLPPDGARRLFDMFSGRDPHVRSTTGGAGLGLAIAAGILRLHGGRISVERGVPRGARFRLEFPAARVRAG
jgi:signal transduction histidine kinase